ncbi:MAG: four helix bundle protein [Verrucomicrobiota bacterium]
MSDNENAKRYDLKDRTVEFAKLGRQFVKKLPRTISNIENAKQFIRASGSVGANYIDANEKKDFVMKIKACRREAKESRYWLRLIDCDGKLGIRPGSSLSRGRGVNENIRRDRSQM